MSIETALRLFKIALGITHDKRDLYFRSMLSAAAAELAGRGVALDPDKVEDSMLLADYCEFNYRNRDEARAMPMHLQLRIRNRQTVGRAGDNGV